MRIKGTSRGLAMALDGNERWCYLDPKLGASHAVAEAARKVACTGATPVAATNCLNFGNPEKPEIMAQLSLAIDGISAACVALGTPITGGNVSLYNETRGQGIYPTPVIGIVGILDQVEQSRRRGFSPRRRRSPADCSRIGSAAGGAHAGIRLLGIRQEGSLRALGHAALPGSAGGSQPAPLPGRAGAAGPDPFGPRCLRWRHCRCFSRSVLSQWDRPARESLQGARSAGGMGSFWRDGEPVHPQLSQGIGSRRSKSWLDSTRA